MLIKRGRNTLMVLSFGKALVSPESRLKQKQPASSGEDTRLAVDFHLMIPRRIYQIYIIYQQKENKSQASENKYAVL